MARILVVDDDQVCLHVLREMLAREQYDVMTAENGQTALDILQAHPLPDLVLLDVMLPDMDGIELCQRLKAVPRTAYLPIILISGFDRDDSRIREGFAVGADGYLMKPVEEIALCAWVKATLRICALQRELAERTVADTVTCEEVLRRFARLSHAVNNSLQALYATVDILAENMAGNPEMDTFIEEILGHAERVAQLVGQASFQAKQHLRQAELAKKGDAAP